MAKGGGNKKIFQYCTDPSGEIIYLRALQGHSGRNLIIAGQCINSGRFLRVHLSRWMCNQFTFHHKFRIEPGVQNLSKRQTVFFLLVNPMDKEHKDPEKIDLEAPRLARYMHTAWKKHKTRCIGSTLNLLKGKD